MNDFVQRIKDLPPQRLVLLAAQLQEQLARAESHKRSDEPIAVVGVGCRFPGGANDPESYWQLLIEGRDAIQEVPPDRWDVDSFYDPDWQVDGKMATRWGGFLEGIDLFDARLFGVSPREAVSMDPQQRLLLETAYQALEHAGIAPGSTLGSRTSVFVGLSSVDYLQVQMRRGLGTIDGYLASGVAPSVAAGRIAYVLGLQGQAISVDTACSSSLVAIHLAMQALRNGECDAALAGGVNVILSPTTSIALSKSQMMALDGRCKAFSAAADGFVRAEGCGMVVLKRLANAKRDGDPIVGLIRGSAVNQDGRSNGLTAPNGPSQEAVIRAALANAGVSAADIGYVEAHGTGTALGDPIEVQALGAALANVANRAARLQIGSVKTNMGHLESAAGIAGLIKALLVLQHGVIPPHLHLQEKSPVISWDAIPIDVPTTATAWPNAQPRLAGVSSFGISGTNAHIVLEAAPLPPVLATQKERDFQVLALSAQSSEALDQQVKQQGVYLASHDVELADFCHTLNLGRDAFSQREALVASTSEEMAQALLARSRGQAFGQSVRGQLDSRRATRPVWLFTGQGSQYNGMGRELYATEPVFAAVLDRCDAYLREKCGMPLLEVMLADDDPRIHQTQYTQPVLFSFEVALAELWRSYGVQPDAVLGHSVGEYSAACVAGLFDLEDGLALIAERGRLMQALPSGGSMVAVFATVDVVAGFVQPFRDTVLIAAINGPESVVISGEAADVQRVLDALGPGIVSRELDVSHAFHSPVMDGVVEAFGRAAEKVTFRQPRTTIISNLDGRPASLDRLGNAEYWKRHIREAVQFAPAMSWLADQGHRVFLEVGPQPTLIGMAARWLDEPSFRWVSSMGKDRSALRDMAAAVAALWAGGVAIDWRGWNGGRLRRTLILPTYPMQRERFWVEGAVPWGSSNEGSVAAVASDVDKMLYGVEWKKQPRQPAPANNGEDVQSSQNWLVVGECALASAVESQLRSTSESVTRISDMDTSDFQDVGLKDVTGTVLVFESQDPRGFDETQSVLMERHRARISIALATVKRLVSEATPPPLWIVTQSAQPAGMSTVDAESATLWGMSHVIEMEHPELKCRRIDLPAGSPADVAGLLIEELRLPVDGEPRVALRNGERFVQRLMPLETLERGRLSLGADGSYLVSGGLRGIGLKVAERLAACGARNLVLFGRSAPDADAEVVLKALREQGVTVIVERADVSNEDDVSRVIDVCRDLAPIRGLIHCAGALADAALVRQDWQHFETTYGPKVFGSLALMKHLRAEELDFVVLFASGAGVVGAPGQANYAAANAYLDALAHRLRGQGVKAVSIDWGAWKDVGSAARTGIDQTPDAFTVEQGLDALENIIQATVDGRGPAQIAVHSGNWAHLAERFAPGTEPSLFRDLFEGLRAKDPSYASKHGSQQVVTAKLREELSTLSERRRRVRLREEVRALAGRVLSIADIERIEVGDPLHDMGLNSLMAIELRNLISASIGSGLPATLLFEHPSVNALVDHLLAEHFDFGTEAPDEVAPSLVTAGGESSLVSTADLNELDDEAFADALTARLDRLAGKSSS